VADQHTEHIEYIGDDPIKITIPSLIWNGFALRLIASQVRPHQAGRDGADHHDQVTAAFLSVTYRVGSRTFTRRFRIEAAVTAFADGVLYTGFQTITVPPQYGSPDNLRATLQFSVSSDNPLSPVAIKVRLIFKDSPIFTPERKERIARQIDDFRNYLVALGFDVPVEVPPLDVSIGNNFVIGGTDPSIYYQTIGIGEKRIDDPMAVRYVFAAYLFPVLMGGKDLSKRDYLFRDFAAHVFATYFSWSFSNKTWDTPPRANSWERALWEIRQCCGQDFTDRTLFYMFKTLSDFTDPVYLKDPKSEYSISPGVSAFLCKRRSG